MRNIITVCFLCSFLLIGSTAFAKTNYIYHYVKFLLAPKPSKQVRAQYRLVSACPAKPREAKNVAWNKSVKLNRGICDAYIVYKNTHHCNVYINKSGKIVKSSKNQQGCSLKVKEIQAIVNGMYGVAYDGKHQYATITYKIPN